VKKPACGACVISLAVFPHCSAAFLSHGARAGGCLSALHMHTCACQRCQLMICSPSALHPLRCDPANASVCLCGGVVCCCCCCKRSWLRGHAPHDQTMRVPVQRHRQQACSQQRPWLHACIHSFSPCDTHAHRATLQPQHTHVRARAAVAFKHTLRLSSTNAAGCAGLSGCVHACMAGRPGCRSLPCGTAPYRNSGCSRHDDT
jgi:hypothetical protein